MPTHHVKNAPNFFVIGAAKCGTTTLYQMLSQHPEVYLPEDKEPRFFNVDEYYQKGIQFYLDTYFPGAEKYPVRGEASPFYLPYSEKSAKRILEAFGPDLKFIVILRDPVQRIWSHYLHMIRLGAESESFENVLKLEAERVKEKKLSWISYFSDGLYAEQLETWFDYFPRENFLILFTEDLKSHPEKISQDMFRFLGVKNDVQLDLGVKANTAAGIKFKLLGGVLNRPNKISNTLKHVLPYSWRKVIRDKVNEWNQSKLTRIESMKEETANKLRQQYESDISKLERISGRDLTHWKYKKG